MHEGGGVLLIESIKWWCTSPKRGHVDLRRGAKQRHVSVIIENKTTQRQEGALTIKLMSADRIVCRYRGGGFRLVLFVLFFPLRTSLNTQLHKTAMTKQHQQQQTTPRDKKEEIMDSPGPSKQDHYRTTGQARKGEKDKRNREKRKRQNIDMLFEYDIRQKSF